MKISEIQIIPVKAQDGLVAFASVIVNCELYLGSIAIHSRRDGRGYRLTFPTKLIAGKNINIYHPINKTTSVAFEKAIITKYKEVMKGNYENTDENEIKTF
ncbi:MAG: septation protein SpoVG family protein [Candidatus Berkelbacteria bacterium]